MFSIFKKKVLGDFSFLQTDLHNHILPGVDDGAKSINDSIELLQQMQQLGYKKIICTPHILGNIYPNKPTTILPALEKVKRVLNENNIAMQVEAAAEYMADENFVEAVEKKKPFLCFGEKKIILIEMSYLAPSPYLEQCVFQLILDGYQPVLAHPERYNYYHKQMNKYEQWKEKGCWLQLNALSLTGYYGKHVKQAAEKLLTAQLIDLLGTDLHHAQHMAALHYLCTTAYYKMLKVYPHFKNNTI
ncbi:MAG: histidinol phosphatase [Hydrotalea flava]|uniref:tyrosine-protein phosphatase n=1 Tax=Hydrotalea TaxID=1004300 RepID=UPI000943FA83|nr:MULTISPECIES: CpsB/CapC family capsule biosynthesis tyrosine phosphatase [Hydrotalea]NIM34219.1 histidinol phosphatase [Hydrotalea flava]NIM37043.1 histidinol phosphatase [Hydrotalea flava]NIN02233.1 histidinol phosphatase [Hydrotalea flava]NIN13888.1 histidinol phosphatase [Hydrotalea flava]NIO92969.1 histidinol phosphatase [Hydrotalea flava]